VNGGDEPKCLKDSESQRWQQEHGRPCGRVELQSVNVVPFQLLGWVLNERLSPLAAEYARALLDGLEPDDRAIILERVSAFLWDRRVKAILYPEPAGER
jgi:hypothetical protein